MILFNVNIDGYVLLLLSVIVWIHYHSNLTQLSKNMLIGGCIILTILLLINNNKKKENFTESTINSTINPTTNTTTNTSNMVLPASATSLNPIVNTGTLISTEIDPNLISNNASMSITQQDIDKMNMPDKKSLGDDNKKVVVVPENVQSLTTINNSEIGAEQRMLIDSKIKNDATFNGTTKTDNIIKAVNGECDCEKVAELAITKFLKDRRIIDNNGLMHYADAYFGDMGYSQLKLDNYIPVGESGNGVYDGWDLAEYNQLNTDRWKLPERNMVQPKMEKMTVPQPVDNNAPLHLANFDYSRRVLGPDNINVDYIKDKLNN